MTQSEPIAERAIWLVGCVWVALKQSATDEAGAQLARSLDSTWRGMKPLEEYETNDRIDAQAAQVSRGLRNEEEMRKARDDRWCQRASRPRFEPALSNSIDSATTADHE